MRFNYGNTMEFSSSVALTSAMSWRSRSLRPLHHLSSSMMPCIPPMPPIKVNMSAVSMGVIYSPPPHAQETRGEENDDEY
nr:MAG TPA: hypothetical protein [Caudoviricetes sp.]